MENNNQNLPSRPVPQAPIPKKWYQHKGIITIMVLAFLAAISCWAYFRFAQTQNVAPIVVHNKTATTTVTTITPTPTSISQASSTPTETTSTNIPANLKQLPDLKLVKFRAGDPTAQVNYYEVQNINVSGANLILAQDGYCDGEGCTPGYYRFLQNGNSYTLLTKYSAPTDGSNGLSMSDLNTSSTSDIDIPALDVPSQLQDPSTKAIVKLNSNSSIYGDMFSSDGTSLTFTVNGHSVFLPNGSREETYWVQSPDGKELTYDLSDPFLQTDQYGNVTTLDIQWNNGISHSDSFSFDPLDSCEEGEAYYNAAKNTTISQSDLIAVGTDKDNGQPVYAIKDPSNPILQAVQAQDQTLNQESNQNGNGTSQVQYSPYDVLYWKDPFGRLIRFVGFGMEACGGKPVIYLYPTKPTNVSVHVNPVGGISKSEPTYGKGWNVLAQPNGTLTDNGQQYPYLFWEGGLGSYQIPDNGFVVTKQQVQQLLADKLSFIGLNAKETSDFEEFWLPRMRSAPYYFVTFTTNSDMNQYAPLNISPKPDTVIRVLMDYKPLENYEAVTPLQLTHSNRNGFTVVEWGGVLK